MALAVLIVLIILYLLQRLFVPKYVDGIVEGAFVAEYYREANKDFDVLFVGDCEVYENFSPVALWNEYGIHSYIRGSAEQYIWQSYYLLEDALRYHKPKVVVFNIQSLQFDKSQSEAYNRMSIEGMRWSMSKVRDIFASMTEEEHFIEYVFPLLRYHSRWNDLSMDDLRYMFSTKPVTFNGYYMRVDALPAKDVPKGKPMADYSFGDNAWKYLEKMRVLCEENGIELITIKAPSLYPYWYEEWDEQAADYAKEHDLMYINFLKIQDQTGIDYDTDTYDAGLHMNLSGAKKLSHYLGRILRAEGVPDRRGDPELDALWAKETKRYNREIKAQKIRYGIE
ncbi:MAG: SGNH/GDSL hydrolase family protein [Lachnospiraceae bacterium]|nr:SGNH/GDSL hydrolase family protein [Lachnospiraceae bacterium]